MRTPRYITILLVLLITTVAGGAVLLPDSDISNDCGESLYEIESIVTKKSIDEFDGSFRVKITVRSVTPATRFSVDEGKMSVDGEFSVKSQREVARYFKEQPRTIERWRAEGMPGKRRCYDLQEIMFWAAGIGKAEDHRPSAPD